MQSSDFKRTGRSGRYIGPDGKEYSRRQRDNAILQSRGWRNSYERDREARHEEYKRWREGADEAGLDRETFEGLYTEALNDDFDPRPRGPFAELLEAIGWREEDADYAVGNTPGKDS